MLFLLFDKWIPGEYSSVTPTIYILSTLEEEEYSVPFFLCEALVCVCLVNSVAQAMYTTWAEA